MPRVRSLPQKKTKVQRSDVERLAKNAKSTLKNIDADKISTVYRFRQQMIPYEVRHQGKIKQVSTSVHAMLNAEEAWRYRRENDERENVRKYKEQQKAKAKERAAREMREKELAKLPPGIRMEIKRQHENHSNTSILEKVLSPSRSETSSPQTSIPVATEDGHFADGEEESLYEDDFEEEYDEEETRRRVDNSIGNDSGDGRVREEDVDDQVLIAAVTTANNAGSVSSFTPSTTAPSRPRSTKSSCQDDAAELKYDDDSFESEDDDMDNNSVFLTDASGSRSSSRAASPTKSKSKLLYEKDFDEAEEKRSTSRASLKQDPPDQVRHEDLGSGEVKELANRLTRTVVRNVAQEEGVSYTSMSSIRTERSGVNLQDKNVQDKQEEGDKTQEYTRTESVVSLSDRVKKDERKESFSHRSIACPSI